MAPSWSGRAGSGLRSPFLLSGLLTCARFGHAYQGRTINSTNFRKDGSKIKTLYYACGGWVMKGALAGEKFLIRKEPLEDLLMETIQGRLASLLTGGGETRLRQYIHDELAAQGQDPRCELTTIRTRIREIDEKANVLLENMSADTKDFVDAKLRDLPRLMESGSLEDRKEFVRAFVAGVSVVPGEPRLDVQMRTLPVVGSLLPANSTCGLVAGARYTPLQMKLQPLNRYLAGPRWAA